MNQFLNVCYLLESANLCGGVRVVLDQARGLKARGHNVVVIALDGNCDWYPYPTTIHYANDFIVGSTDLNIDVVVATFWTTVKPALAIKSKLVVHLCQGLEWECPEYENIALKIQSAYSHPIPKITVGPWLNKKIRHHFNNKSFPIACVGQSVDTHLYQPLPLLSRTSKRLFRHYGNTKILVPGMFECSGKGIRTALNAIKILRSNGLGVEVIRISTQPLHPEENTITTINYYHESVTPREMKKLYHDADIVITVSFSEEGFGLPFAEALACGAAVVASTIPSYLSLDKTHNYAQFVPIGDVSATALAIEELIKSPEKRKILANRGANLLRNKFNANTVARKIEKIFLKWLKTSNE